MLAQSTGGSKAVLSTKRALKSCSHLDMKTLSVDHQARGKDVAVCAGTASSSLLPHMLDSIEHPSASVLVVVMPGCERGRLARPVRIFARVIHSSALQTFGTRAMRRGHKEVDQPLQSGHASQAQVFVPYRMYRYLSFFLPAHREALVMSNLAGFKKAID